MMKEYAKFTWKFTPQAYKLVLLGIGEDAYFVLKMLCSKVSSASFNISFAAESSLQKF